jgi:hypothetical protein
LSEKRNDHSVDKREDCSRFVLYNELLMKCWAHVQVEEVTTKHGHPISVVYDVVAQLVEQFPFKERVESSSLSGIILR